MKPHACISDYFNTLEPHPGGIPSCASHEIREALRREGPGRWYNRFEVVQGSGIFTEPYLVDFNGDVFFRALAVDPSSLEGIRVLDIGAFDGAVSFYAEDHGSTVTAIDIQSPASTGFAAVHKIRSSTVTHVRCSIYDLHPDLFGLFDLVVMSGVHYHLRHPLLAFERVNSVMQIGSKLLVVGTVGDYWLHSSADQTIGLEPSNTPGINKLPICGFYKDPFMGDYSNWFVPTTEALSDMLQSCGFGIDQSLCTRIEHPGIQSKHIGCATISTRKLGAPAPEFKVESTVIGGLSIRPGTNRSSSPFRRVLNCCAHNVLGASKTSHDNVYVERVRRKSMIIPTVRSVGFCRAGFPAPVAAGHPARCQRTRASFSRLALVFVTHAAMQAFARNW